MYAFIDDSGDPGFKTSSGSTASLVMACLFFEEGEHVERAANEMRSYRQSLGRRDLHEFKFNRESHAGRVKLCELAARQQMFIRAIRIRKDGLHSDFLRNEKGSLYQYAIRQMLSKSGEVAHSLKVTLDGSGDRDYRRVMSNYLRKECNKDFPRLIRKVTLVDSKKDQLVQLADIVAGAVRLRFDGRKSNAREPYRALSPLMKDTRSDVWDFN